MPNIDRDVEPSQAPRPVNAELIGGVVGGVLSVLIIGITVLLISCFCYRYLRTAKMSPNEINL